MAWVKTQLRANLALAGSDQWKAALENFKNMDQALSRTELKTSIVVNNLVFEEWSI
jgi:hypothetical protein